MNKRLALFGALMGALLVAVPARAATKEDEASWSVESGKTVGSGQSVFWGQVGFPGIWLEYIAGLERNFEIGGKFAFNYGQEGVVSGCCTVGMDFQFLARYSFFDNGKIRIAGRFDPGFLLYFPSSGPFVNSTAQFGLTFPLSVEFGFPVSRAVSINATFGLPMYVFFSAGARGGYFALPILFGGGVEYLIERNVALTFSLKLGPTIYTSSGVFGGGASAVFTLYAMFGVAYKF